MVIFRFFSNTYTPKEISEQLVKNIINSCSNESTTITINISGNTINSQSQIATNIITTHAALITSIHYIVGIEVGAYFVEKAVGFFMDEYRKAISNIRNENE